MTSSKIEVSVETACVRSPTVREGKLRRCFFLTIGLLTHPERSPKDENNKPKELWVVNGATHDELEHFAGPEYRLRVLQSLGRYLRNESP